MASILDQLSEEQSEDRNFFINLIKKEDKNLSFAPKSGKSEVWNRFERIYYKNTETIFVKCKYCNDIQKNRKGGGTSGLLSHKCPQFLEYLQSEEGMNSQINYGLNESEDKTFSDTENEFFNDKSFLKGLIDSNDYRLSFGAKSGRSKAWDRFVRVFYDNYETHYVKCIYCNDILKNIKRGGTTGLLTHKCQQYLECSQSEEAMDSKFSYGLNESVDRVKNEDNDDLDDSESNDVFNSFNDKTFLKGLLESKDERLTFHKKKGKSEVWNRFERIFYENVETIFVKCVYCDNIQMYKKRDGTTGLLNHRCPQFLDKIHTGEAVDLHFNYELNQSEGKSRNEESEALSESETNDYFNDKNYLKGLIESYDERLSFHKKKGKSEVWNRFERIFHENNETLYVKCKFCDLIQKYKRRDGTTGLLNHKCKQFLDYLQTEEGMSYGINVNEDKTFSDSECNDIYNDKNYLKGLIESYDERLSFSSLNGKSEAWNKFERIYHENLETLYVKCKYCDHILMHKRRDGTTALLNHKCQQFLDSLDFQSDKYLDEDNESRSSHEFDDTINELSIAENNSSHPMNDRNHLMELIKSRDERLTFVQQRGKSHVWDRFERVLYEDKKTLYVKCKYCDYIQKNKKRAGTGGLIKHKCEEFKIYCQSEEAINSNGNKSYDHQNDDSLCEVIFTESGEQFNTFNDKSFLKGLIETSDERLSYESQITKRCHKSDAWNRFERILYDNKATHYVKCRFCNDIQKNKRRSGTTGLLHHKCKEYIDYLKSINPNKKVIKKKLIDEKLLVKKLSHENKILKIVVQKCLKMIDKCLCINKNNTNDRKEINVLINNYNKTSNMFNEQINNKLVQESDYEKNIESDEEYSSKEDLESDNDPEYRPSSEKKSKQSALKPTQHSKPLPAQHLGHNSRFISQNSRMSSQITRFIPQNQRLYQHLNYNSQHLRLNANQNLNKLQIIGNSLNQKLTNAIKKKYIKVKKFKNPIENLMCEWPGCEKVFKTNQKLREHRDTVHLDIKNHSCDWPGCDDRFFTKSQLKIHVSKYHTNEKPFKCDQCSYSTLYKDHLKNHKNTHMGIKPWVCDWPGCEFASTYEQCLRVHKRKHSGSRPFKCSWPSCEWSFRTSRHLKVHTFKHTGEKPYYCEHIGCDRRFTSRQAMRFHMERVHRNALKIYPLNSD